MSTRRLRNLGDAFRAGVQLEIVCANAICGRSRVVAPALLLGTFPMDATFARIGARMVCRGADLAGGGCGHRGALVRYVFDDGPNGPGAGPGVGDNVVPLAPRIIDRNSSTGSRRRRTAKRLLSRRLRQQGRAAKR